MSKSTAYDVIIIGAGHNGLTAAALLAKQGRSVLVLERRKIIGGLAAGEEFHPGYRSSGLLHDTGQLRTRLLRALDLKSHGLEIYPRRPSILALDPAGRGMLLSGKERRTAKEIRSCSAADADQYLKYRRFIKRVARFVNRIMDQPPPAVESLNDHSFWDLFKTGLAMRRMGKATMHEFMRVAPMCVADWLNEWFENDCLKAALAVAGLTGSFAAPRSPGTACNLLMWECSAVNSIKGGPPALIAALAKAAQSRGVEIRVESEVGKLQVSGDQIKGVVLKDGESIEAAVVAASCDPRHTFLDLLPPDRIENRQQRRFQNIRGIGTTAKVNLALNAPIEFKDRSGEKIEFARAGRRLESIEKAFDACKYGQFAATPVMDIHVPTVSDPDLTPAGHSVVSILAHFVPYGLQPQWDQDQVEKLGHAVVATLEQYAPGVTGAIVAREVLSPVDLEARYGLVNGHIFHGEHALDQLILRPTPECARYYTPIKGLYLCGSGSHPGGGITCGPGALAASVIAKT